MTTMHKLSLKEAISLLNNDKLSTDHSIDFASTDQIEVPIALKLRRLGFEVPQDLIKYPDELGKEVEDDDFEGDWIEIESDIADHLNHVTIKLSVDQDVENWLEKSNIDLDSLVSELITGFYKSTKLIESK